MNLRFRNFKLLLTFLYLFQSSLGDGRPLRSGKGHFPKELEWEHFDVFYLLDGHLSRKQVGPGAGNVYYKQLGNAGSINNQGAVNNQAARAVKDGTGPGSANVQQENSQTQTASANPVTTTVQVDAATSTTDYTGSTAALPAASVLAPGVGFSGVGVGSLITTLPGPDPFSSGLVRQETARLIAKATIGDSGSENPEVEIAHLGVQEEMAEDWDERILLEQRMRVVGLRYVRERRLDGIVVFADDGSVFSPKFFAEAQRVPWFGAGSVGVLLPVGFTELMGSEEQAEEQSSQGEGLGKSKGQGRKQKRGHGHGRRIASVDSSEGSGSGGGGGAGSVEAAAAAGVGLALEGGGAEREKGAEGGEAGGTGGGVDGEGRVGEMAGGEQRLQQGEERKQEGQGEWQTQQQKLQQTQGKQGEGGNGVGDGDEQSKMRLPQRRLLQASSQSASSSMLRVGKQTRYQMPVQGPVCNNESVLIGWHTVVHHPDRLLLGLPSYNSLGPEEEQRRGMLWHGYVFNSRLLWARKEELPDWVRGWDEWGPELERGLGGGSEEGLEGVSEEDSKGGSVAGSVAEGRLFDLLGAVVRNEKEVQLIGQCGRRVLVWWWRAEARQDSKFPAEWVVSPQLPITVRAKSTPWPDPLPPPPPSPPSPPSPLPPPKSKKDGGKKKGGKHKNNH
ncbi:unnamed protein product [Closterium sp. NIES-53]